MLNFIIAIIGIILTIFIIVGFHEFGHFIVARMVGIKVLRFSIGFGKTLFRFFDKRGTEYVIAAIPLGGYVKMLDSTEENIPEDQKPFAYNYQPIYKKMLVVLAGPFFNFLLAFLIYWLIFMIGFSSIVPIIGTVQPNSIAAKAHLKPNDEIVSINGKTTLSWTSVMMKLLIYVGDKAQIQFETKQPNRNITEKHTLDLTHWYLDPLKPDPLKSLGITPYQPTTRPWPTSFIRYNQYGPFASIPHAFENTVNYIELNFILLGKMVLGKISLKSMGGPITIFESAGTALTVGMLPFMSFLAFLSIAIGAINIIPIPGLDGGHLLFNFIEWVTRKPLSLKVQFFLYRLGFLLLLLLIIQAFINDFMRL